MHRLRRLGRGGRVQPDPRRFPVSCQELSAATTVVAVGRLFAQQEGTIH
jgi:hypothetical protein